jgi:hypothetical protein
MLLLLLLSHPRNILTVCSFVGRLFDDRSRDASTAAAAAAAAATTTKIKAKLRFARTRALSLGQLKVGAKADVWVLVVGGRTFCFFYHMV